MVQTGAHRTLLRNATTEPGPSPLMASAWYAPSWKSCLSGRGVGCPTSSGRNGAKFEARASSHCLVEAAGRQVRICDNVLSLHCACRGCCPTSSSGSIAKRLAGCFLPHCPGGLQAGLKAVTPLCVWIVLAGACRGCHPTSSSSVAKCLAGMSSLLCRNVSCSQVSACDTAESLHCVCLCLLSMPPALFRVQCCGSSMMLMLIRAEHVSISRTAVCGFQGLVGCRCAFQHGVLLVQGSA